MASLPAPSMVRKRSEFLPRMGKLCGILSWYTCITDIVLPNPHPLTVTQALNFMMDLEDDSDWSLSDEPEDEDSTR